MAENWWLIALVVLAIAVGIWWLVGKGDAPTPRLDKDRPLERTIARPAPPPVVPPPTAPISTSDADLDELPPVVVGPAATPFDMAPPPIPPVEVARTAPAPTASAADDLTLLKGVGPKLAATLGELGVTRYAQIADWSDDDVERIDERLGAFKGRPARDRWIEQARLLADGDRAGFEERFGRLG